MNVSQISMFALSAVGTVGPAYGATPASDHPNIVIIMTDQQQYDKIGWLGTPGLSTPAMDRIAENGITFTNAYCSFPLSIPSRFSMFTGFYPSEFNLRRNPKSPEQKSEIELDRVAEYSDRMMANLFNAAGYDGPLSVEWEDSGMDRITGATESLEYVKKINFSPSDIAFDSALSVD